MKSITKLLSIAVLATIGYITATHGEDNKNQDTSRCKQETKKQNIFQQKSNRRLLELPGKLNKTPEKIISHTGYTLSFNREHNQPNWVAWELTADETQGYLKRSDDFQPDPMVPSPHQVTSEDYKHSGYDRGHMVPAADMKWDPKAMNECFYMSNICPQDHGLNSGPWSTLEKACRRWAQQEDCIYIACGPIFNGKSQKTIGKDHKITIPDGFYKVVLSMKSGNEKAIGFYYSNKSGKQSMGEAATSVDDIEKLTGIDFFVNIPDKLEKKIEANFNLAKWQ